MNRLIRLVDPNIEIIYILPFHINDEILTYYVSLLENIGIKNIEDRLHFFVPEASESFPSNYCLSKLIYFSPRLISEIKSLVKYKEAYIIPGEISYLEEKICFLFEKPIFGYIIAVLYNILFIYYWYNRTSLFSIIAFSILYFIIIKIFQTKFIQK